MSALGPKIKVKNIVMVIKIKFLNWILIDKLDIKTTSVFITVANSFESVVWQKFKTGLHVGSES